MRITQNHIESLVRRVFIGLEKQKMVRFNKSKEAVLAQAKAIINEDLKKEAELDEEVRGMVDDLEKEQGENFERHRLFVMIKKKVAEERGLVL